MISYTPNSMCDILCHCIETPGCKLNKGPVLFNMCNSHANSAVVDLITDLRR